MLVKVFITPKEEILDPAGRAVAQALRSLGLEQVQSVKVGKYLVLRLEVASPAQALQAAAKACEQLLANPLTEDYRYEVEPE